MVNTSYFSSNFGVKLVMASKERIVKAERVLPAGPQAAPMMETTLITLMHIVIHSEKIELEVLIIPFPANTYLLFYYLIERLGHWTH